MTRNTEHSSAEKSNNAEDSSSPTDSSSVASSSGQGLTRSQFDRRSFIKLGTAAWATLGGVGGVASAQQATERYGIAFDSVVNAVDDLGWDPTGTQTIDVPSTDGQLIEVPAGEYEFPGTGDQTGVMNAEVTNWGLRGLGDSPDDVTFRVSNGLSTRFINTDFGSSGVLVENLSFDNTANPTGGDIGNRFRMDDALEIHDVNHRGFSGQEPYCRWTLYPTISEPSGVGNIVNFSKTGPSVFVGHGLSDGGGGIFGSHEGLLNFRGCAIANQGGDGGMYTGRHEGDIIWEDCYFANNDMAVIRTGAGCELRRCTILMDWDNAHPENVIDTENPPTGTNGVFLSTAEYAKSGGGFYDCDVIIESTYDPGVAAFNIDTCEGALDIHDTRIQVNVDDMYAIWCRDPNNQRFSVYETPSRPWSIDIRNVSITGSGDMDGAAILLDGRDESVIANSCIQTDSSADGIVLRNTESCSVTDTNINVGGERIVTQQSTVSTSNLTDDGSCPAPTIGESGFDTLTVIGDGPRTTYSFEVDGTIEATDSVEPFQETIETTPGPDTASGVVYGGVDEFRVSGTLTDFQTVGPLTVLINGDPVDLSQFEENLPNTLTIDGDGPRTTYRFTVDGTIRDTESVERNQDTIETTTGLDTASGIVYGQIDEFRFSGTLVDFQTDGTPTVLVNGEPLDLSQFYPNTLTVIGDGPRTTYSFEVDGTIVGTESLEPNQETIETTPGPDTASGIVYGQSDEFMFSGAVTDFQTDGTPTVLVNGTELDLSEFDGGA